ncbi:MAG: response regulator [Candidatus Marinimicrobia bacterium]|jgi:DNA-binding NtrC family response regulator|nr:response regulator [Candidatus Neomarinimicrobiota bacterium]MCK9484302.1 response regulator [Candidatus Neomarinimicrobiota bacterium]MCK9559425.1 response regulator [Candidatus Neomarinimicrobiota bacterium]
MKSNILIVDNDAVICEIYGEFLEQNGYSVTTALSVDKALRLIKEQRPDLILSEVVMLSRNGFEFYDEVKSIYPEISFVFMTGHDNDPKIIENLDRYGKKWFAKPIQLDEMLKVIRGELFAT